MGSFVISEMVARKRSTQQTYIIVELQSVVYGIRNIEDEIREEFDFYLGNITSEMFQLVSINHVEGRDL